MKQETEKYECVTFIHFNDVYDIERDSKNKFGFVNFYDAYLKLKQKYPNAITVFSGDAFAPSKLSRVKKGWQMVHCLKLLNIDIACYGNHQFDFTPQHSLELAKQCNFPWLLGNVKYTNTEKNLGNGLNYYVMQRQGIKIGFIGLAGPDFKGRLILCYKNILTYQNHIEKAKELCKILKQEGCALIVALTHMRMGPDEQLAKNVPQIDLILGGHDHFVVCKIANKIPILKSGSNFQNIGVYQVANSAKKYKQIKTFQGRRWAFAFHCLNVEKTSNKYSQLQDYIISVVQQYNERGLSKNTVGSKQNKKSCVKYENQWKLSYGVMNGKPTLSINSNLLSQICFAKYLCFQKGIYYIGNNQTHQLHKFSMHELIQHLRYICKQITKHNIGQPFLYSKGFPCIPYIVQCCNFVYLPNQLCCAFNKISELQQILSQANKKGLQCYAVINYVQDYMQIRKKDNFSAIIKFVDIPKFYLDAAKEKNNILITFSIQSQVQPLYLKLKQSKIDILLQMPQSTTNMLMEAFDIQQCLFKFVKYIKFMQSHITDLQVSRQNMQMQINKLRQNHKLCEKSKQLCKKLQQFDNQKPGLIKKNKEIIQVSIKESGKLSAQYINSFIAMCMGRQHMKVNRKNQEQGVWKGVVFNEGEVSYPTYQLAYGYLPILFQIRQSEASTQKCRLLQLLGEHELQLQRWFNVKQEHISSYFSQKAYKNAIYELLGEKNKQINQVVIKNTKRKLKTAEWVTKYAKPTYANVKSLSLDDFLLSIQKLQKCNSFQQI